MKRCFKIFKSKGVLSAIFAVSFVLQAVLFLKNPSFWHDEAALALNITNRSFVGLLGGLDNLQVAPPAFLFLSKFMLLVFNPKTDYWRDFCLRIIPFAFGILSIAGFYYLSKLVFQSRKQVLFANFMFALNPCLILYSAQYKQYSMELFVSVILLAVFYNIINGSFKKYYYLVLFFAPLFSYSSIFILISGCILSFRKRVCIPVLAGLLFIYFINLRFVFDVNYSGMDNFYSDFYSFVSINKPIRLVTRFSELFVAYKIKLLSVITGILLLIITLKQQYRKILPLYSPLSYLPPFYLPLWHLPLWYLPLLGVILASSLHKYPVQARLILFLLPIFVILITSYRGKIVKTLFTIIFIISAPFYTIYADWLSYSYARDIVYVLKSSIKPEDKIVIDRGGYEYKFYLQNSGIENEILVVPDFCYADTQICKDFINKLPKGSYYFLSTGYGADELTRAESLKVGYEPEHIKAVFINK